MKPSKDIERLKEVEQLEYVTAGDLNTKAFRPKEKDLLKQMISGIEESPSYVTRDGMWKYDRIPQQLVLDLLCYLENRLYEVKNTEETE